ncbi:putative reverse transcriptase domain-containing protein, partial [Tanacetum coccineum]
ILGVLQEAQEDRAADRAEIEIFMRERLAYEQESIETRQALARSEAYNRVLEAHIRVLETQVYRHKWKRQDADDRAIEHIIRKANVVADALSRKERLKPRRAQALSMTIHSSIKAKILEAQSEASKVINTLAERLRGFEKQLESKEDNGLTRLDMSTAYHPQTDGQSERTMKTLEDMHTACTIDFEGNWDTHLPLVEFPYNNGYHPSVKCAPFEALYGRRCRLGKAWYVSVRETSFQRDM